MLAIDEVQAAVIILALASELTINIYRWCPQYCQCGGIGRHAAFKMPFLRECRFESDHWYHNLFCTNPRSPQKPRIYRAFGALRFPSC
jgi:hypothetical protein